MMNRQRVNYFGFVCVLLCVGLSRAWAQQPAAVVEMTDSLRFSPSPVVITAGEMIEWRNVSLVVHTVTADPSLAVTPSHASVPEGAAPFNSGNIPPGGTYQRTFSVPGTYNYFCIPHETVGMLGQIQVTSAGAAPTLSDQPDSQTVTVGADVTFSVTASGTAPFSYQWQKDGSPLPGQTSATLSLTSVQSSDAGTYTVVVSNSAGSVTSQGATLTVESVPRLPTLSRQPTSQTASANRDALLSVNASGTTPLSFQWRKDGVPISGANQANLALFNVSASDQGSYSVEVSNSAGSVTSQSAVLTVSQSASSRLVNLSTRARVGTGETVVIPGFVLAGEGTAPILVRGVGPGLARFGVMNRLEDPVLRLMRGGEELRSNRKWGNSENLPAMRQAMNRVGAFTLSEGSDDASVLADVSAGSFTAPIAGAGDAGGICLVEIYDASTAVSPSVRLRNISTRAQVGTGDSILIPGFVVEGSANATLLIRAVGPGLNQFGVDGALANPTFTLLSGESQILVNDDWNAAAFQQQLRESTSRVGAFVLDENSADAASLAIVPPGAYTVQVSGVGGGTGISLVEIYEIPPAVDSSGSQVAGADDESIY